MRSPVETAGVRRCTEVVPALGLLGLRPPSLLALQGGQPHEAVNCHWTTSGPIEFLPLATKNLRQHP